MSKILYFYGTKADVLEVTKKVEFKHSIIYTRCRQTTSLPPEIFKSAVQIPNLGIATHPSAVGCEKFLVSDVETVIKPRRLKTLTDSDVGQSLVANKDCLKPLVGVDRYAIDQLQNQDTICFSPGGRLSDRTLLHGGITTVSESQKSQLLMKEFLSVIKKAYIKIKAFYVGPEALALLKNGGRLTISAQSPPEFDLTIDAG